MFLTGGDVNGARNEGTRRGYTREYLRESVVDDPIFERKNTGDNTPAIIHTRIVPGDRTRIIVAPKGGGSETMSGVGMLKPSDGVDRSWILLLRRYKTPAPTYALP